MFNLPAGAPFLPALSRALLEGKLIADFPTADSLDLARATIYLPTQRAAAALGRELLRASGRPALLLPRIAPLGAFEPDYGEPAETAEIDAALRPPVGDLSRKMALASLTLKWSEALKGAIRRVGRDGRLEFDESEPPLVAASPAQALSLADDLAALIDDMIIEDIDPEKLKGLVADAFDPYWGITLEFLKIAFETWPKWLDERGAVDRARSTAERVQREIEALASPDRGPVIIAGSTGANRATARLIAAIARAPQGAVVLPDLDRLLDPAAFALVGGEGVVDGPRAGHPQTLLRRLLETIGIARDEVRELVDAPLALKQRARALSEALRPAETTEVWPERRKAIGDAAIAEGLAGLKLIVADNEAEEALALAVAMRESLEVPGQRAALITPDATIARRVEAELARWDIEVENSAGARLASTPIGEIARLALIASLDFSPANLAALIERQIVTGANDEILRGARALQLGVFRLPPGSPKLDNVEGALAAARQAAIDHRAHRALQTLTPGDFDAGREALTALVAALAPLRAIERAPAHKFIEAHRFALEALTRLDDDALDSLFDEWADASQQSFELSLADYAALFGGLAAGRRAPRDHKAHPRLAILGLLEARLIDVDLALVAGLDETIWPPAPDTDPFLNRAMRAELGLSPPERRIGQTAHDFVSALGAPQAILSRAKKRGGAPTVASRFLQRLAAFAGEKEMATLSARGEVYVEWARRLDHPVDRPEPAPRPEPKPPVARRPSRLSVTRIETLRRDPYAIYAEFVLQLLPLPPIGAELGAREMGTMWHAALEQFSRGSEPGETDEARRARLAAEAQVAFAPLLDDPVFRALRWPRVNEAMERFLEFDAARRAEAAEVFIEAVGELQIELPGAPPFTLTGRADRIEILPGGGAVIIDYKTGAPPGQAEVAAGFAPQLTLEAAMLERGAFRKLPSAKSEELIYFKLGGSDGGKARPFKPPKDRTLDEIVAGHFVFLKQMLTDFAREETPYLPRPFPKFLGRGSDYDHLARVGEWGLAGEEET